MASTLKRGIFHISSGLLIVVAALFLPKAVLLISLAAVTFIFLVFEFLRLRAPAINKWFLFYFRPLLRAEEVSHLTGSSYLLIASLITIAVFPREIALLAICFLAVGDAMATIIGRYAGKRRVLGKTLEGDLACLISCLVVGFIFYHAGLNIRWPTILAGSLSATIVEAIPLPINDNLTMPLLAGIVMTVIEL